MCRGELSAEGVSIWGLRTLAICSFFLWVCGYVAAVCSASVAFLYVSFDILEGGGDFMGEISIALLISSLASSHVLYSLSAACLVCLVAMLIASAACSVQI